MKQGLLVHNTKNIGDEIQSLAASQFLSHVDYYLDRENLNNIPKNEDIFVIMNAWWMHKTNIFPPSENLIPKYISVHFNKQMKKQILKKKSYNHLKSHEPIGCRDIDTMNFLKNNNIKAYFSGCLTLTLKKDSNLDKLQNIFIVDAPKNTAKILSKKTNRRIVEISHKVSSFYSPKEKLYIAKKYLNIYQRAHLVITTRLHVALPCLAFETPVIFINENNNPERFTGLLELINSVNLDRYENYLEQYDFEKPLENPRDYLEIRNNLINEVKSITNEYHSIEFNKENFFEEFELYKDGGNELKIFSENLFSSLELKVLANLNIKFIKRIFYKIFSKVKSIIIADLS